MIDEHEQERQIRFRAWAQVPVELLVSRLSMEAKALYAIMRSFGPESRASIKGLAARMYADRPTITRRQCLNVKQAQHELVDGGWIELEAEGTGKGKGQKGVPRIWRILDMPPNFKGARFCATTNLRGLKNGPPKQISKSSSKHLKKEKKSVCMTHSLVKPTAEKSTPKTTHTSLASPSPKDQAKTPTLIHPLQARLEAIAQSSPGAGTPHAAELPTQSESYDHLAQAYALFCNDSFWRARNLPWRGFVKQLSQFLALAKKPPASQKPTKPDPKTCTHPKRLHRLPVRHLDPIRGWTDTTRCACGHIVHVDYEYPTPPEELRP
jgi:hypothetical protein